MSLTISPSFSGFKTPEIDPSDKPSQEQETQEPEKPSAEESEDDESEFDEDLPQKNDLTYDHVDVDLTGFEKPNFKQMAAENEKLTEMAQQYEQESRASDSSKPNSAKRSKSFLSVVTKVTPGESMESPTVSEHDDVDNPDLMDVSSDVNRLDTDVTDLRERVTATTDGQKLIQNHVTALEARFDGLDQKIRQLEVSITALTTSMNSYQTSTAAAMANLGRKQKIMNTTELSSLQAIVEPPATVSHGEKTLDVNIPAGTLAKTKKLADLSDWGL